MQGAKKTIELKVVRIGNSKGVRLPKAILERYAISESLVLEAREEGLLLRGKRDNRLSWQQTYRDMADKHEDWSDFDSTIADGLHPKGTW